MILRRQFAELLTNKTSFHISRTGLLLLLIFFVTIICVAILSLYVHWVWRCWWPSLVGPVQEEAGTHGLDEEAISGLPVVLVSKEVCGVGETECCICLGVFEEEEKLKVLPNCNHAYHSDCLDEWLRAGSNCPLCRAALSLFAPSSPSLGV